MFSEEIDGILNNLDLSSTRVVSLPQIILVLGGRSDIRVIEPNQSNRHIFVTEMLRVENPLAQLLKMPEQYPEWNQFDGYPNLVEFERDAGSLSKAILLFSESPGAVAELSNFANDPVLRDRLIAVLSNEHYQQESYIKYGPIKQIEDSSHDSICVIGASKPSEFMSEVGDVAQALQAKCDSKPRTTKFDLDQKRDRLLLMADLVDLFSALSLKDFETIFTRFNIPSDLKTIKRELKLLKMFELVNSSTSDREFYVAPQGAMRQSFLNYQAKSGYPSFDRTRQKVRFIDLMKQDRPRQKAYQFIHGLAST